MAWATGPPASRKDKKFTPFTTRPSFTSRQGMTRILSISSSRVGQGSEGEKRTAASRFTWDSGGLYQRLRFVQVGEGLFQSRHLPARGLRTKGLLAREMHRRSELLHRQCDILAFIR